MNCQAQTPLYIYAYIWTYVCTCCPNHITVNVWMQVCAPVITAILPKQLHWYCWIVQLDSITAKEFNLQWHTHTHRYIYIYVNVYTYVYRGVLSANEFLVAFLRFLGANLIIKSDTTYKQLLLSSLSVRLNCFVFLCFNCQQYLVAAKINLKVQMCWWEFKRKLNNFWNIFAAFKSFFSPF